MKILSSTLFEMENRGITFFLSEIRGGTAHNIIPRDASCIFFVEEKELNNIREICRFTKNNFLHYLDLEDHNLSLEITAILNVEKRVVSFSDKSDLINLLNIFPHGAYSYDFNFKDILVNTSSNLAIFNFLNGELYIETSLRFMNKFAIRSIELSLKAIASSFFLSMKERSRYPNWEPVLNSDLEKAAVAAFEENFDITPSIKAIHAGLECGILKEKIGDIDAISIGPNIHSVHSPTESMEIESSINIYKLLKKILEKL